MELKDGFNGSWRNLKYISGGKNPPPKYPTLLDPVTNPPTKAKTNLEKSNLLTRHLENIFKYF